MLTPINEVFVLIYLRVSLRISIGVVSSGSEGSACKGSRRWSIVNVARGGGDSVVVGHLYDKEGRENRECKELLGYYLPT